MAETLTIDGRIRQRIDRHARWFSPNECMGLLAARRNNRPGLVTAACLLPARVAAAHAEAAPLDIAHAAAWLRARRLKPVGIWHSHALFCVHHSRVDDETVARLLPAMAEDNFRRPCIGPRTPFVNAPDEAYLPLPDGTSLRFTLLGPPISAQGSRLRVAWSRVTTRFRDDDRARIPRAIQGAGRLHLAAGPVVLTLGLPPGTELNSEVVDLSSVRVAHLYSLVVNARGESYAEVLTVREIDGRSITEQGPCDIEVVPGPLRPARPPCDHRVALEVPMIEPHDTLDESKRTATTHGVPACHDEPGPL